MKPVLCAVGGRIKIISLVIIVGWSLTPIQAGRYSNGVDLVNRDGRTHQIVYFQPVSTRICWTRKPGRYKKNGLAPAHLRGPRGFQVLETSYRKKKHLIQIRALIAPRTRVNCVCTAKCQIQVVGVGGTKLLEDRIITIGKKGRLRVE